MNIKMILQHNFRVIFLLIIIFVFSACSDSDNNSSSSSPVYQQGDYVSVVSKGEFGRDIINLGITNSPLQNIAASHNVNTYKLAYKTLDSNGNLTTASGFLAIPQKGALSSPLLSLQHGTIFLDSDAPSNANVSTLNSYNTAVQAVVAASAGYIVIAPDYLGYGDSDIDVHPYMQADSLATSIVDFIRAAKRYLQDNNIPHNGQLFLAGYSEGGYATLATHKMLQENYSNTITVTASAPGAGAYDMYNTALEFATSDTLNDPTFVTFVMKAYDEIYGLNRISDYFQLTYVDFINSAFTGSTSYDTINQTLPANTELLFNATFLQEFNGNGELELKNLFMGNNIYAWAPTAPTFFFHGPDDSTVPYLNAETAFNYMQNIPETQVTLQICTVNPADHGNCFIPYINYVISTFSIIAANLTE